MSIFTYSECNDLDCLCRTPPNTISLWDCLREDYMLTYTGNRVYWAGDTLPKGPWYIQEKQNDSCE